VAFKEALDNNETAPLLYRVSVASMYRWLRSYKRSGHDLRSLIPDFDQRGGLQKSRLDASEAIVDQVINDYLGVREKVSISEIHDEVVVRVKEENALLPSERHLRAPSQSTIARRIRALDPERFRSVRNNME
jgi:hypothetical protein